MKNIKIGYSSLSNRVFMGKSKPIKGGKPGQMLFTGEKVDITSKFLHTVAQYFEVGTSTVMSGGGKKESQIFHIENTDEARQKLIDNLSKKLGK